MSDMQRRQLCRLSFLLFAILPTVSVAVWLLWPSRGKIDPDIVGYSLGVRIDIQDARTVTSTETLWRNVSLSDSLHGDLGAIGQLEIQHANRQLHLLADHLLLNQSASRTFFNDLIDRFLVRQSIPLDQVHVRINRLTLTHRQTDADGNRTQVPVQTFEEVSIDLESAGGQIELNLRLRPASGDSNSFVELMFRRHISVEEQPPHITWSLSTASHAVDCQLAAPWLPFLDALGESATFMGKVQGSLESGQWSAELIGVFQGIDLYQLVSVPLHHTLHGNQAQARFESLKLEQGRIIEARGLLLCPRGQVSRTLVDAAMLHFGWTLYSNRHTWPASFRDLRLAFATSATGDRLEVRGLDQGVIAYDESGNPWLIESAQPVVPTTALVAMLVPPASTEVPLTRETAPLANLLPLPTQKTLVPSASGTQRLRLEDSTTAPRN